ncbi:MAG: domain containing protein, partial [Friedmanniella sp.]|nr:domain containing protein [Friedmanniella sp.]
MSNTLSVRRVCASGVAFVLLLVGLVSTAGVASAATADAPVQQRSATNVTADALPTVQINGVVWDQAVAGTTVYAGGQFTRARPAGSAAGVNETVRNNLLAYDITTGNLIPSFAPSLDGVVKVLALSPDKSRLYVGGSFTNANGVFHARIAAYSTATGALVAAFSPKLDAQVLSLAVTNNAVYVGGIFSKANDVPRSRLAAFSPTDGSLLGWAPTADLDVNALLVSPDGTRVIAGGAFSTINGATATGLAAIDVTTAALLPFAANTVIRNYGNTAAVLSLKTDGTNVFGSAYWFGGTGNFEGVFSVKPGDGSINWLADCHGDTYDVQPVNGTVYSVSHHHNCANIGSFPEQNPRAHWRANAFTANATGTVQHNTQGGYYDFFGAGAPSQVNWFPDLAAGSFTGQTQAAWTVEATSDYVVAGGEFPKVNGTAQQGLVRFAVGAKAPRKMANQIYSADSAPSLSAVSGNAVRVSWGTNWDRDDALLTYQVRRADKATPVFTATDVQSLWWNRRTLSFLDTGLAPNTTYTYQIRENDPDGNVAYSQSVAVTTGATAIPDNAYSQQVLADGASDFWRMTDKAGATAITNWAGPSDLAPGSGVALGATGQVVGSNDGAATFDGTTNGTA